MRASASNDVFFSTDQTFMRRETGRVVFINGGISYRTKQRRTPTLDVTNEQVFLKKKKKKSREVIYRGHKLLSLNFFFARV